MVIKKIFEGDFDEEVHNDFMKFSRGEYKNRYLVEAKKQAKKIAIKTSSEYANLLVMNCINKISEDSLAVKGIIVSTTDLSEVIPFDIKKKSNFQGVRKFQIDTEIKTSDLVDLMKKYPKAFYALSFKGEDLQLKVKAKAPKSGKPGKGDEDPKADFCNLKTSDRELISEILFDVEEFKEVKINHTIAVEEIVYPSDVENLSPKEIRERAKRKGKVYRKIIIDGNEKVSNAEFEA
jgi:hypothetical protein